MDIKMMFINNDSLNCNNKLINNNNKNWISYSGESKMIRNVIKNFI